jgi:hypothetical protein
MQGKRTDISWPPKELDIKNLNDMTRDIYNALFGNLDFKNLNGAVKEQLFTQQLNIDKEINIDKSFPANFRYPISADAKKIKSAKLSVIVSRYRMDSGVAKAPSQSIAIQGSAGLSTQNAGSNFSTTLSTKNWFAHSSNTTYVFEQPGQTVFDMDDVGPLNSINDDMGRKSSFYGWSQSTPDGDLYSPLVCAVPVGYKPDGSEPGTLYAFIDFAKLQHNHDFFFNWLHSHPITLSGTVAGHEHPLDEGIHVSSTPPEDVKISVNGHDLEIVMNEANAVTNDIDIAQYLNIGQTNTITVTTSNLAHIEIYGIIELSMRIY